MGRHAERDEYFGCGRRAAHCQIHSDMATATGTKSTSGTQAAKAGLKEEAETEAPRGLLGRRWGRGDGARSRVKEGEKAPTVEAN